MSREVRRVPANWEHPKMMRCEDRKGDRCINGNCTCYRPMHEGGIEAYKERYLDWEKELKEWNENWKLWQEGKHEHPDGHIETKLEAETRWADSLAEERKKYDNYGGANYKSNYCIEEEALYRSGKTLYSDCAGEPPSPPNPDDYIPVGEWWQMYQTVSEGTPLTPPFATDEELIQWMAHNKDAWGAQWTEEGARKLVKSGYAPSGIMTNGKFYTPEEQHKIGAE